jgi:hypothetical protein
MGTSGEGHGPTRGNGKGHACLWTDIQQQWVTNSMYVLVVGIATQTSCVVSECGSRHWLKRHGAGSAFVS